jgi:hypothetical protein
VFEGCLSPFYIIVGKKILYKYNMSLPFNKNADPVPVYFARVPETPQNMPFEPQRVRVLENSTAVLYADNRDRELGGDPFSFRVKFSQTPQNIKRIGLVAANLTPLCGQINPKNNQLIIVVTTGPFAGAYTYTLPNGYYSTGADFVAAINPALTPAPYGLTLAWSQQTQRFTFSSAQSFYIVPTCSFIRFGVNVFGFPVSTTPSTSVVSEFAGLRFNRAILIRSNTLTQYEKNNSTSSNPRLSDPLVVILTGGDGPLNAEAGPRLQQYFTQFPEYRNFESGTQITSADFEILDEWGDSPITYTDSPTMWRVQIIIYTQV